MQMNVFLSTFFAGVGVMASAVTLDEPKQTFAEVQDPEREKTADYSIMIPANELEA